MGRELRRVPLDFDYPIGELWKGYVNPYHGESCTHCQQSGYNPETTKISEEWYSFGKSDWVYISPSRRYNRLAWNHNITDDDIDALMKHGRLSDVSGFWGRYNEEKDIWEKYDSDLRKYVECEKPTYPTTAQVNEWNITGLGHDSLNKHICVKAKATKLGVYGLCEKCDGELVVYETEELKKLHDEWESYDPPTGEGYQLWNTTTEGHPMTPVFKTLEELCQYLADSKVSVFGYDTATYEEWMEMLSENFVAVKKGNVVWM